MIQRNLVEMNSQISTCSRDAGSYMLFEIAFIEKCLSAIYESRDHTFTNLDCLSGETYDTLDFDDIHAISIDDDFTTLKWRNTRRNTIDDDDALWFEIWHHGIPINTVGPDGEYAIEYDSYENQRSDDAEKSKHIYELLRKLGIAMAVEDVETTIGNHFLERAKKGIR